MVCLALIVTGMIACSEKAETGKGNPGACEDHPSAHAADVNALAFSRDGKVLYTASSDKTIKQWEMPSGKPAGTWKGDTTGVFALAVSPDGKLLASGSLNLIRLWELPSGKPVAAWNKSDPQYKTPTVRTLAFSPDGKLLYSGSDLPDVETWEVPSGKSGSSYSHTNGVALALDQDGWLAMCGMGHNIGYYRPLSHNFGRENDDPYSLAFSPDGSRLAAGYLHSVKIWTMPDGKSPAELAGTGTGPATLAYSPDGRWLAGGFEEGFITVWDASQGKVAFTLKGHQENITSVAFSPDGGLLASASEDNTVRLWKFPGGEFSACLSDATVPKKKAQDPAPSAEAVSNQISFEGSLASLHIWMDLQVPDSDGVVKGTYEYFKHGKLIPVAGVKKGDSLSLEETNAGKITGIFTLVKATDENVARLEGIWRKPGGKATTPVSVRQIDPTHKSCAQIEESRLILADDYRGDFRSQDEDSPFDGDDEEEAETDAETGNPFERSYSITSCGHGLMGIRASVRADRHGNSFADQRVFEITGRTEIEWNDQIDAHKYPRFREYVANLLNPKLAEIRSGNPDSVWKELLTPILDSPPDSVGEYFSYSENMELRAHLDFDVVSVGLDRYLGFDFQRAQELGVPEEVFVEIPYGDLRTFLKKNSPYRRLGAGD